MAAIPVNSVQGAPRKPLPYGLFSVLDFRPEGRWAGSVEFETLGCDPAQGRSGPDCDAASVVGLPKTLTSTVGTLGLASSFAVYGHFNCTPVGWSPEQGQRLANEHLAAREEHRVEQAFWTGDLGNTPSLQGATSLNGGAATSPEVGVALLEQWIAENYGSLGVIHMTRMAASLFGDFEKKDGRLVTLLDTPVVAGSGYPGTGPAAQAISGGQSWVYVTPALFGYRSEVFVSSNVPGDLLDRNQNDLYAIAEREYLLGFDPCGAAAVLIDPTI